MSTKPRTPEHFPHMKHRAAKRQVIYVDIMPDLGAFVEAARAASRALAGMSLAQRSLLGWEAVKEEPAA